jgi:hypothetical protein
LSIAPTCRVTVNKLSGRVLTWLVTLLPYRDGVPLAGRQKSAPHPASPRGRGELITNLSIEKVQFIKSSTHLLSSTCR